MQVLKDKPVTVLHLLTRLPVGGVENMLMKVVTGYDKEKFCPIICCIQEGGEVAEELKDAGHEVVILHKMKRHGFDWSVIGKLREIFRERTVQVLRTHQYHANLYGRIAGVLAGVPVMIPSFHNLYRSPEKPKYHRRIINSILGGFSDTLVAVSNTVAQDVVRYDRMKQGKVRVIYNGVDISRFAIDITRNEARKRLNLPVNGTIVGTVGRLTDQKGHAHLLHAVSRLENVTVAVAGDGPLRDHLRRMADELNVDCVLPGELAGEQVPVFLRALNVFCFPSLWEGLPSALVEAMASGLPVVASDIPPHRELLEGAGLFAGPGDSGLLAEKLTALLQDDSMMREMGNNASTRAGMFSIERTVSAYEALYEELLRKKGHL